MGPLTGFLRKSILLTMKIAVSLCALLVGWGHSQDWKVLHLNPDFYAESISAGDFNRDGKPDAVAGPYWFPGPEFTDKTEYTKPKSSPFNTNGDSDNYSHYVYDMDGDGYDDILWQKRWDDSLNWFENPGESPSNRWTKHPGFPVVGNESPWFTDVTGDGKPEGVGIYSDAIGIMKPDWTNPSLKWKFEELTKGRKFKLLTHGLGVGDVNGDGHMDLLEKFGWWENPGDGGKFKFHEHKFRDKRYSKESEGGGHMHVYDVDGDGDGDVITSLQAHGYDLAWFENLDGKGGSFKKHMIMGKPGEEDLYGIAFSQMHAVELGDLNGDGLEDIVTGKRKGAHGAEKSAPAILAWFELVRDSAADSVYYKPHVIDSMAGVGTQIHLRDMDGDGAVDVLTAARQGAFIFLNRMEQADAVSILKPNQESSPKNLGSWNARGQSLGDEKSRTIRLQHEP